MTDVAVATGVNEGKVERNLPCLYNYMIGEPNASVAWFQGERLTLNKYNCMRRRYPILCFVDNQTVLSNDGFAAVTAVAVATGTSRRHSSLLCIC